MTYDGGRADADDGRPTRKRDGRNALGLHHHLDL